MKKLIDQIIIDRLEELEAEALLLDGKMVLGTHAHGYVYAPVDAPEEVYWNSEIQTEKAVEIFKNAKTVERID